MSQPSLFDPSQTVPTPCPVPGCQAIRFPGQTKVPTCDVDRDRALGISPRWKRPGGCLNTYDPAHDPFPKGY